jgi:hypothetical protein
LARDAEFNQVRFLVVSRLQLVMDNASKMENRLPTKHRIDPVTDAPFPTALPQGMEYLILRVPKQGEDMLHPPTHPGVLLDQAPDHNVRVTGQSRGMDYHRVVCFHRPRRGMNLRNKSFGLSFHGYLVQFTVFFPTTLT